MRRCRSTMSQWGGPVMTPFTSGQPIRVLLVDDSPVAIHVLKKILASALDIEVVGTAGDGREALKLVKQFNPDVICTDLHMPIMDGMEFTREVIKQFPKPILVISISVSEDKTSNVFNLLQAGAIDVLAKPTDGMQPDDQRLSRELVRKIRLLSGVVMFSRISAHKEKNHDHPPIPHSKSSARIVVIGSSTGGPQALAAILPELPASFRLPIVCVQHIGQGFLPGLVDWLNDHCALHIIPAMEGDAPLPGHVYFSREDAHLTINRNGKFAYRTDDGHGICPSVDITMESIADSYGSDTVGVLLTGMGDDGARGMLKISQAGGLTIAQDQASCIVFGMPRCAIELGAAQHTLSLEQIVEILHEIAVDTMHQNKTQERSLWQKF